MRWQRRPHPGSRHRRQVVRPRPPPPSRGEDVEHIRGPAGGNNQDGSEVSCKEPRSKSAALATYQQRRQTLPTRQQRSPTRQGKRPTGQGRGPTRQGKRPTGQGRGPRSHVSVMSTGKKEGFTSLSPQRPRPWPRPWHGYKHLNECKWLSSRHFFFFLPVLGTVGIGILPVPARLGYLPSAGTSLLDNKRGVPVARPHGG
jgi:hypothetical protein